MSSLLLPTTAMQWWPKRQFGPANLHFGPTNLLYHILSIVPEQIPKPNSDMMPRDKPWTPFTHQPHEIVHRLLQNIESIEHGETEIEVPVPADTETHLDLLFLNTYFAFFNSVFFMDLLTKELCSAVQITTTSSTSSTSTLMFQPNLKDDSIYFCPTASYSIIYVPLQPQSKTRADRQLAYLGSLLHEMIHAFQEIYTQTPSCGCKTCPEFGEEGHSLQWAILAHKFEIFASSMLDMSLDLGRGKAMAHELRGLGIDTVNDTVHHNIHFADLDLDADAVQLELDHLASKDALANGISNTDDAAEEEMPLVSALEDEESNQSYGFEIIPPLIVILVCTILSYVILWAYFEVADDAATVQAAQAERQEFAQLQRDYRRTLIGMRELKAVWEFEKQYGAD